MASVKPGRQYYWRPFRKDGLTLAGGNHQMHLDLLDWCKENVLPCKWSYYGDMVDDITFYFTFDEDAIAFKLKFGL